MSTAIKRIGIPRAFFFHIYPTLFETFFKLLGIEPVISSKTTKDTLQRAINVCEAEHCLPNKIFDGHVAELLHSVDAIFVPRLISLTDGYIACPRFGALPDATRSWVGPNKRIISPEINATRQPLKKTLIQLGKSLGASSGNARHAATEALGVYRRHSLPTSAPTAFPASEKNILVLGHPYTLHDTFLSKPLLQKLQTMKVPFELISFTDGNPGNNEILWCTFAKMYQRLCDLDSKSYAGVVQLTTFNCGCDSMMMERFGRLCKKHEIPYMILMVDEHTGRAGMETRLEAFVDSIRWRARGRMQGRGT